MVMNFKYLKYIALSSITIVSSVKLIDYLTLNESIFALTFFTSFIVIPINFIFKRTFKLKADGFKNYLKKILIALLLLGFLLPMALI